MTRSLGIVARAAWMAAALLSGCVTLERDYPEKRYFVVELGESAPRSNPAGNRTLMVSGLRISPRYADKSFVYRTSDSGYEADFYNQFLTSPDVIFSEELRRGLSASSAFRHVVGPSSPLQPNFVLEGSINALYGDFRNLDKPAAVLEIEFFLHHEDGNNPGIVLQRRYVKTVPIAARSPEALVKGWSQALGAILTDLNADLGKIKS
jgi:uncharacterized lipoprotein YmbA